MRSFTLNSQFNSATQFGIRILEPIPIPTTQRVVEQIEVDGRAGTLTCELGWEDQNIEIHCAISGINGKSGLEMYRNFAAFTAGTIPLMSTITRLELSTNPGVYYKVKHIQLSETTRLTSALWEFTITFTCEPFTYLTGIEPITLTASGQVVNPGLVTAEPVITVYGTGTLTFRINDTTHTVKSPAGQVTIDSARKMCHVAGNIQTDALIGGFPILQPMSNQITLGTGISKLAIEPNWRNP
ncbi:MAG: hypothetical protein MSC45_00765 [Mobiluncus sp.]|uniref:hypothetical protein n=1 Tax=Mobiluncus sp. TaxID=47293 RepID=UPI002589F476|nr:hypothetical protein [Mobiluncus sp.]MCI6583586.1 hypothetical protein [Mobiluncus sp.]